MSCELWDACTLQVCSSSNGEDPSCSDSLLAPISIADHMVYLQQNITTAGCSESAAEGMADDIAAAQDAVTRLFGDVRVQ